MADQTVSVRLRAVTSQFTSAMRSAAGSMGAIERNAGKLTAVGGMLSKTLTPAMLGVAGAVTAVGMNFESAMSGVGAVTGAGTQAMADMSAQAQELGRTTQYSASEAAGALEFLGMAGFSAQEATEALPETLSLAAAGGLELANAADLASNVLQQFALPVEETSRVVDVLAQTAVNSNTSVEQLGQALTMAGPVANAAGLEIEETAAAIGAMGNAGIQASTAGTSLRGAMVRLLNASGPAADTLDRLGINAERADGSIRPLDEIIDQLSDSGATAGDMMEIFGQRAGPAMAALVQQGGDSLRELTATIDDSAGAAKRMADVRMDNLSGDLKELKSAAEGAGIALFEAGLGGKLRDMAQGATGAVQWIAELPDPMLNTAVAAGAVAAAAGPAIQGIALIGGQYRQAARRARNFVTSSGKVATFLRGPWGIAMAGAAVAVGLLAKQHAESKQAVEEFTAAIEADSGALGENTRKAAFNRLEKEGLLEDARKLGISPSTLTDAVLGDADAQRKLATGLKDARDGLEELRGSGAFAARRSELARFANEVNGVTGEIDLAGEAWEQWEADLAGQNLVKAREATAELGGHMERMPGIFNGGTSAAEDYERGLDGVTEGSDDAAEATVNLNDAINGLFDPVLGAADALQEVADAEAEIASVREGTVGTDGDFATQAEKADALEEALRRQLDAAIEADGAMRTLKDAIEDGTVSTDDAKRMLEGWIEQGWLSREAADVFMTAVSDLEGELDTLTKREWNLRMVADTTGAIEDIRELERFLTDVTGTKYVHVEGSRSTVVPKGVTRASGGPVGPELGAVLVGEDGPEVVTFGARGMVHDAQDTRQMLSGPQVSAATGGTRTASSGRPVQLFLDGKMVVEAIIDPLSGEVTSRQLQTAGASSW